MPAQLSLKHTSRFLLFSVAVGLVFGGCLQPMTVRAQETSSNKSFSLADAPRSMPHTETFAGVPCQVIEGERTGPVVLLLGSARTKTNEFPKKADEYALEQISGWPILRGKVVFLSTPDTSNMPVNRSVFVEAVRPDWVIELRDDEKAKNALVRVIVSTNSAPEIQNEARKLRNQKNGDTKPPLTSDTNPTNPAINDALGVLAQSAVNCGRPLISVVAAGKGLHPAPSVRTRHLRRTVARLLTDLQMAPVTENRLENALCPPLVRSPSVIRVAMYDSDGAAGKGPGAMETALSSQTDVCFRRVCATDIQTGALEGFDVLINPGGSSAKQGRNLSDTGRAAVQKFIAGGGGYLGICAGFYLASSGYKWSLGLVDADIADKTHANRGRAMLQMELTPRGREVFGDLPQSVLTVIYHNGPVLAPNTRRADSGFEPLAVYRTEIAQRRGRKNIMVGSAAIAADKYGNGRVIGISPHPEQTPGLTEMVPRAVRWLAGPRAIKDARQP